MVALLIMGSAILLFSCKSKQNTAEESLDAIKTEQSENLTIIMSENGRKSYLFKTPLLEGYTLGRDPYREFRKGIAITTYQDDSLTTVNAVLVANYAIYYENRKLWEAKGDVVITKHDGTRLYTQQLFWNSITKRIYSNVDTKLVTETDEVVGEGFESDEDMNEPRFRRWKGRMQVDTEQLRNDAKGDDDEKDDKAKSEEKKEEKKEEKNSADKRVGQKVKAEQKTGAGQKRVASQSSKSHQAKPQSHQAKPQSHSVKPQSHPAKPQSHPHKRPMPNQSSAGKRPNMANQSLQSPNGVRKPMSGATSKGGSLSQKNRESAAMPSRRMTPPSSTPQQ